MGTICRLQSELEKVNNLQQEADEIAHGGRELCCASHITVQQNALYASLRASERGYQLSRSILMQSPDSDREAFILMVHLVQQIGLIAADHIGEDTEIALRAGETLLAWFSRSLPIASSITGWAREVILESQLRELAGKKSM